MKRHNIILIFIPLSIGVVMAYLVERFNLFGFNKTSYNIGKIGSDIFSIGAENDSSLFSETVPLNLSPFGIAGTYVGELRTQTFPDDGSGGLAHNYYSWDAGAGWVLINYDYWSVF